MIRAHQGDQAIRCLAIRCLAIRGRKPTGVAHRSRSVVFLRRFCVHAGVGDAPGHFRARLVRL